MQKVITPNEAIVPFFSERMDFIRGLDPLGLQNTSDATFTLLLPGMNNVTGRIRYYSFYCWLLDQYSHTIGSTDPEDQRRFIRKAEYLIALSSTFYEGDSSSIPGSNYAKAEMQKPNVSVFDLIAGITKADGSTRDTYWNFSWGAFGQYYLGSLRDIGVVIDRDISSGVYARTNSKEDLFVSGEMLAAAFDDSIPNDKKELFLNCLLDGHCTRGQLQSLLPEFNLTRIPEDSEEEALLTRLLLQKDYPVRIEEDAAVFRRETTRHLLAFAQTEPPQLAARPFVYAAYDTKGIRHGMVDESLFGWYYYQFNEFWHYANTSIFNGVLDYLEHTRGPNWVPLQAFVDEITAKVLDSFLNEGLAGKTDLTVDTVLQGIVDDEYRCFEKLSQQVRIEKIVNGFMLMFTQYIHNKEELVVLKAFGEKYDLAKDGEGPGYFMHQFILALNQPLKTFIRSYIYKNIINRHQLVAFRKIRGGGLSTQKFIIEDHHIRYLGNFEAGYTGPRIGNLISFLEDLHIIGQNDSLTSYGEQVLHQLQAVHD